jgi:hypothetical protein
MVVGMCWVWRCIRKGAYWMCWIGMAFVTDGLEFGLVV